MSAFSSHLKEVLYDASDESIDITAAELLDKLDLYGSASINVEDNSLYIDLLKLDNTCPIHNILYKSYKHAKMTGNIDIAGEIESLFVKDT